MWLCLVRVNSSFGFRVFFRCRCSLVLGKVLSYLYMGWVFD